MLSCVSWNPRSALPRYVRTNPVEIEKTCFDCRIKMDNYFLKFTSLLEPFVSSFSLRAAACSSI